MGRLIEHFTVVGVLSCCIIFKGAGDYLQRPFLCLTFTSRAFLVNMRTIKPIKTRYNGVEYRSRMESLFARWCDSWGLLYQYECEGYEFNGERYLPDFYLPESQTFVEVKPQVAIREADKMKRFIEAARSNDSEKESYRPHAWIVEMNQTSCNVLTHFLDCGWREPGTDNGAVVCAECYKPYLIDEGGWECKHCGYYDGDHSYLRNIDWGQESEAVGLDQGKIPFNI